VNIAKGGFDRKLYKPCLRILLTMAEGPDYTIDDVYRIAGKELVAKLRGIIDDKKNTDENIVEWFYKPNKFFENKSPFEICKEPEGRSRLEKAIMDILNAAQGS